jgi:hypothetical protein
VSEFLQWLVVGMAVGASAVYALRAVTPFRVRVWIATHTAGRLPDRMRIWLAGPTACQACGSSLNKAIVLKK